MIEGKGLGGKRVARVNASITNKEDSDLKKLATACGMKHTELTWHLIRRCLYDPIIVNEFLDEYCKENSYRVWLVQKDGEIHYQLNGRYDI
ncbi:hypothetical protein [Neobacillus niacini]|uniref:hypothetical protein n=1 Tax=Neobacillus niacini TaxID=86668 RepID=UPI0021CAFEA6|nr:hypothetical protein [Neobacillus niacini]MCM3763422.1 hypothetical protein [Neobacillus niacini]